jgi:cell wall-associated NlpC family hydrolase
MTLRSSIRQLTLVTAIALGAAALPATAHADQTRPMSFSPMSFIAPLSAPVPQVAPAAVGKDDLAGQAASALEVWAAYSTSGERSLLTRFGALRDSVAADAATRLQLDPAAMQAAWRNADTTHLLVLLTAFTQLGVPYRAFKRIPGVGFDCSALTSWAWEQSGVQIPRNSRMQIRTLPNVDQGTAQPGDVVWYPGHVMLYLGVGDAILHAPNSGRRISLAHLPKHRHFVKFANPMA